MPLFIPPTPISKGLQRIRASGPGVGKTIRQNIPSKKLKPGRPPRKAYDTVQAVPFDFWGAPVYRDTNGKLACPGFIGPTYATNSWDFVGINGALPGSDQFDKTPGIADIQVEKRLGIDKKRNPGSDGARLTAIGLDVAEIRISLLIWTPEQLRILNEMWPVLMAKSGKKLPTAFSVVHPKLKLHDVNAMMVYAGIGPEPGPVTRSKVFTIMALEYRAPSAAKTSRVISPEAPMSTLLDAKGEAKSGKSGSNEANKGPTAR